MRARVLLSLLGVAAFLAALPPRNLGPLGLLSLLLLAASLRGLSPRASLALGALFGCAMCLVANRWLVGTVVRFTGASPPAAVLAWLLAASLNGLPVGLAGWLSARLRPTLSEPLALGLAVFVCERFGPAVLSWQLASPLLDLPGLPQSAEWLGVSGLGAVLLGCASAGLEGAARLRAGERSRGLRLLSVALLAPLALGVAGGLRARSLRAAREGAPRLRVALVQPDVPIEVRHDESLAPAILADLQGLTRQASAYGPGLVVWPEALYPYVLPHRAGRDGADAPAMLPPADPTTLLAGAVTRDAQRRQYNSALLREAGGALGAPVDKVWLVPFGEYLPLVGELAWFRRVFARAVGNAAGDAPERLRTRSGVELGVLNCFEDTMPFAAAPLGDAEVLVNLTNDGWFGPTEEPPIHEMLARWRAIELRRELLRAVNNGPSAHFGADGAPLARAPQTGRAVLVAEVARLRGFTLSRVVSRWGPWLGLALCAGLLASSLRRGREPAA